MSVYLVDAAVSPQDALLQALTPEEVAELDDEDYIQDEHGVTVVSFQDGTSAYIVDNDFTN